MSAVPAMRSVESAADDAAPRPPRLRRRAALSCLGPLLAAVLAVAPGIAQDPGSECPAPKTVTRFHAPHVFRRGLEDFRRDLEREREALEARRPGLEAREYRAGLAAYRRGFAAYREALALSRRCPHAPNAVLTLGVRPVPSLPDDDRLLLTVRYYHTGERGDAVSIGAITLLDGRSTGHWAYTPARLAPGYHTASIKLGMSKSAPDRYRSDAVEISMYEHRGSEFHSRSFPLARDWVRGR